MQIPEEIPVQLMQEDPVVTGTVNLFGDLVPKRSQIMIIEFVLSMTSLSCTQKRYRWITLLETYSITLIDSIRSNQTRTSN